MCSDSHAVYGQSHCVTKWHLGGGAPQEGAEEEGTRGQASLRSNAATSAACGYKPGRLPGIGYQFVAEMVSKFYLQVCLEPSLTGAVL